MRRHLANFATKSGSFFKRRWAEMLIPALLSLAPLYMAASDTGPIPRLTQLNFDLFMNWAPREPDPDWPVRIIDIDDKSLAEVGQWPWPRTVMAALIDRLTEYDVASIGLDIVFAEPDRTSPTRMMESVKLLPAQVVPAGLSEALAVLPDNDEIFAQAIAASGRVVTGFSLDAAGGEAAPKQHRRGKVRVRAAQRGDAEPPALDTLLQAAPGAVINLPLLADAAAGNGHFNPVSDGDGLIRRLPLLQTFKGPDGEAAFYPALSIEAYRVGKEPKRATLAIIQTDPTQQIGLETVRIGRDTDVKVDRNGFMRVYFSGTRPERYISAIDVLNGTVPREELEGRIVLVGTSAAGLKDLRSTPLDNFIAGVEIHAEAIEQIMQRVFIDRGLEARGLETLAAGALAIIAILGLQVLGPISMSLVVAAGTAGIYGGAFHLFAEDRVLIDPILPGLTMAVAFFSALALNLLRTQNEKGELRSAFGLYLSPELVDELADHPEKLTLGGEIRDMTILFSDIRGFTSISEQYDPESLTKLINDFLTPMTGLVLEYRGTIDKYMGDALMAFWNAPLDDADHAIHACEAALRMTAVLGPLNERLEQEAKAAGRRFLPLNAGIGLNTGPCCVGNMGSEQRFAYSVLGDAVNLASRLEGQTKSYGMAMIIGEATKASIEARHAQAGGTAPRFALIELDLIQVKGKLEPVRIFGLLGDADCAADPQFTAFADAVQAMIDSYRAQDWTAARTHLAAAEAAGKAMAQVGKLPRGANLAVLFDLYRERLDAFEANPPGADWDGVFIATSK